MFEFTLDDVRRIIRSCAGVDESVDLNGDVLDVEFAELGYDSLAVLELSARVQREYGVPMPDDAPSHMTTPREAITFVNVQFAAHRSGARIPSGTGAVA